MSSSTESQPNPLPRLFAAALGLLLMAIIIAISLFGRFAYSPPTSTDLEIQLTSQSNPTTELVRQRAVIVMVSVAVMAGLVMIGGLAVTLLLNRRLNQRYTTAEIWKNAHQAELIRATVDSQTMCRVHQVSRTPRYAGHISQGRRR